MEQGLHLMEEVDFWTSRVILTGAELDVFTRLDGESLTAEQVAKRIGGNPRATDRLLDALAALGLLEKQKDLFSLTPKGKLLSSRHPETMLPAVLHYSGLWQSWGQLTSVVREGRPAKRAGTGMDEEQRKAFIGAMDVLGRDLSVSIADAFDATRFRRLLDIGGGSGTYTIAFLRKYPQLQGVLFDLPPVIAIARERLGVEGLSDRMSLLPGDYNRDPFPSGCDLALLSAVIHQNSAAQNLDLFTKVCRALDPGGTLLIRDFIMDHSRTGPVKGTLFALNMLVNTPGGDTYTFAEVKGSLEKAGFVDVTILRTGDQQDGLVSADKPSQCQGWFSTGGPFKSFRHPLYAVWVTFIA
jgi:SAM-dependent methyltransferase